MSITSHTTGLPMGSTPPDTTPEDDTAPRWVRIDVKVGPEKSNEADPWYPPSACEVAAEIRKRMEDLDMGTGWVITKVGC